jgi:putative inorganic carbon (hco3(-)) transporter
VTNAIEHFNTKVMPALSLEKADACWGSTLAGSALCRPLQAIVQSASAALAGFSTIGTRLQQASFCVVLLLCLILAAPQFANDKEGLALVVLLATGLRVAGSLTGGREKFKPTAVDALVLLFFASNVVSSFASHYLHESLFGLAKLVVYVVAYYLFVACFQTNSKQRIIGAFATLALGALLVSLYGLYQYKMGVAPLATWEDPSIEDKATRVFSTLGNPNLLAGYLVPIIPISFALSAIGFCRADRFRWLGLALLGVSAIILVATVLTGSRGAYIAFLFMAAMMAVVTFSWIWRQVPRARVLLIGGLLLLPVAIVVIVHFALPSFEHRFLSIFAGTEHSSNAYRVNVWKSSYEMFKDNWWLGIGTGNKTFRLAYGLYMRSSFDALGTYCVPLEVAVETGLPGLFIFGWLLLATMARAHNRFWSTTDPTTRWISVGCAGAIIGMMAHGLVDTVFLRPQVQFIFWLAISLLVALPSAKEDIGNDISK